ncbi:cytochrome C, partial [Aromatoleum diolicum]|nr:cytochrome C [Aromatoleum diolicum]
MNILNLKASLAAVVLAVLLPISSQAAPAGEGSTKLDNATCLECHETGKREIEVTDKDGEAVALPAVVPDKFAKSVHAGMDCVACHTDIVDAKEAHQKAANVAKPDCASCHVQLWDEA